jgi:hypothetical protein
MNIKEQTPERAQPAPFALLRPQQEVMKLALQLFFRFASFTLRRTDTGSAPNKALSVYQMGMDRSRPAMVDERRPVEVDE